MLGFKMKKFFSQLLVYSFLSALLVLSACGGGSKSTVPPTAPYKIIDLGLGYAGDINEKGHVTGRKDDEAYTYNGTSFKSIGTIGAGLVSPVGINDNGEVVAIYRPTSGSADTSVAYYDGTSWTLLGKFGSEFAWPDDINDIGQIAGTHKLSGHGNRAFIYTSGTVTVIPVPGKASFESSYNHSSEINKNGLVSGTYKDTSNIEKAFISDGTSVTEIGSLADPFPGRFSRGNGLNDAGHSVGVSQNSSYLRRAFLYKDSTMTDLGTLGGNSEAFDINNNGIIVGTYVDSNGDSRAFIYDSEMKDLTKILNDGNWVSNGSYWVLTTARNINDKGVIIGRGIINNETHGYMLIPQ